MRFQRQLACSWAVVWAAVLLAACAQPPGDGRVLRLSYPYGLVTLDPHAHASCVTRGVLSAVYEAPVEFERGLPVRPWLADRWSNPDRMTWLLHIRAGVRFHDGRELTAADVAASINRAREDPVGGVDLQEIERVAVDPEGEDVVRITTRGPSPMLLTRLASVAIVPFDFDPSQPVGTGPYRWHIGSEEGPIVLKRWDGYWKTAADFAEVFIEFVAPTRVMEGLERRSEPDVVTTVDVGAIRNRPVPRGWKLVASPAMTTAFLGINVRRPPLSEREVRVAIDRAIDRRQLLSRVFPDGTAQPAWSLVPHDIAGYTPQLRRVEAAEPRVPPRPAGVATEGPGRLELAYTRERFARVAPVIVENLASIGLEVSNAGCEFEDFYSRLQADAGLDLFLFSWTYRVADSSRFLSLLIHSRDAIRGLGRLNGTAHRDDELDRLIESTAGEPDIGPRIEGLQRALLAADDARIYLPLYRPSNLSLVRDDLVVERFSCPTVRPQDVRVLRN